MRDMKDIKYFEGIVVPKDYPAFYKNTTTLNKICVKVGDYVEECDVLAIGEIQTYGMSVEDYNSQISYQSQMGDIQSKITDKEIEIENYTRTAAEEDGDSEAVEDSDKKLALLNEDKRYNSAVSDYKISKYAEARDELSEEIGEATLVAEHSGYVTFIKDISDSDMAAAYENVVVISDMEDLYIECSSIPVKLYKYADFDEKYTYDQMMDMARKSDYDKLIDPNDKSFVAPESMVDAIRNYLGDKDLPIGDLLKSVYLSLANSYNTAVKIIEKLSNKTIENIFIVGGGSKDAYLNDLTAETTGKKVIIGLDEATATGNILSQIMFDKGIDLNGAREIIKKSFNIREIEV